MTDQSIVVAIINDVYNQDWPARIKDLTLEIIRAAIYPQLELTCIFAKDATVTYITVPL